MVEVRGRAVGGEAVYRCNPGFVLRGSTTRICVEDGQWTGEQPVCEGKIYMEYTSMYISTKILSYRSVVFGC